MLTKNNYTTTQVFARMKIQIFFKGTFLSMGIQEFKYLRISAWGKKLKETVLIFKGTVELKTILH